MNNFDFAIVLDFEATCFGPNEKPPVGWKPEILEFPAVLVQLETGEILDEFHHFISPTENGELSPFCRKFLHLADRDLTGESDLENVLEKFILWIRKMEEMHHFKFYYKNIDLNNEKYDKIGCFASWTDWDIGTQLIRREIFQNFFFKN